MSGLFAGKCVENVLNHIGYMEREEDLREGYISQPIVNHCMNKLLNRIDRTMDGEVLGDMVESDLEDLRVDDDFEEVRGRME